MIDSRINNIGVSFRVTTTSFKLPKCELTFKGGTCMRSIENIDVPLDSIITYVGSYFNSYISSRIHLLWIDMLNSYIMIPSNVAIDSVSLEPCDPPKIKDEWHILRIPDCNFLECYMCCEVKHQEKSLLEFDSGDIIKINKITSDGVECSATYTLHQLPYKFTIPFERIVSFKDVTSYNLEVGAIKKYIRDREIITLKFASVREYALPMDVLRAYFYFYSNTEKYKIAQLLHLITYKDSDVNIYSHMELFNDITNGNPDRSLVVNERTYEFIRNFKPASSDIDTICRNLKPLTYYADEGYNVKLPSGVEWTVSKGDSLGTYKLTNDTHEINVDNWVVRVLFPAVRFASTSEYMEYKEQLAVDKVNLFNLLTGYSFEPCDIVNFQDNPYLEDDTGYSNFRFIGAYAPDLDMGIIPIIDSCLKNSELNSHDDPYIPIVEISYFESNLSKITFINRDSDKFTIYCDKENRFTLSSAELDEAISFFKDAFGDTFSDITNLTELKDALNTVGLDIILL